jgi:hypothetical protein
VRNPRIGGGRGGTAVRATDRTCGRGGPNTPVVLCRVARIYPQAVVNPDAPEGVGFEPTGRFPVRGYPGDH